MTFTRPDYLLTAGVLLFGLVLLAATLLTRRQRPRALLDKAVWLLVVGGVLAYAGGGAMFCALVAGVALSTYYTAAAIERARASGRLHAAHAWLAAGLGLNLLALGAIEFAPWFAFSRGLTALGAGAGVLHVKVLLPVGVSLFTLHAASLLVDVYRGHARAPAGASQAGVYLVLLPQFVAGPAAYRSSAVQLARRSVGMSDFAYGVRRLAIGVGKRLFIAGPCAAMADAIFARQPADLTAGAAWLGAACATVQIYFVFSAYADMAIGLGRLFGLRLDENFRWPYAAESLADFWRRWHMGLTSWFREYAMPGSPASPASPASAPSRAIAPVLLCALWYGTTASCIAWGLYHAAWLAVERRRVLDVRRMPSLLRRAYLIAVVMIGWVVLRAATPHDAMLFLKAMAGAGSGAHARVRPLPVPLELWGALVAGAIGSAPLARALRRWSVAIDAATTSAVMMLFATVVFVWRSLDVRKKSLGGFLRET